MSSQQQPTAQEYRAMTAFELTRRAKSGDIEATFWLGLAYWLATRGAPQDYKKAVKCFRKAANTGHAIAQAALGGWPGITTDRL